MAFLGAIFKIFFILPLLVFFVITILGSYAKIGMVVDLFKKKKYRQMVKEIGLIIGFMSLAVVIAFIQVRFW